MNTLTESEKSARRVLAKLGLTHEMVVKVTATIPKVAPLKPSALNRAASVQKEPSKMQDWHAEPTLIEACQRLKARLEARRGEGHSELMKIMRLAGYKRNVAGNLMSGMVRVISWEKVHRLNDALDKREAGCE